MNISERLLRITDHLKFSNHDCHFSPTSELTRNVTVPGVEVQPPPRGCERCHSILLTPESLSFVANLIREFDVAVDQEFQQVVGPHPEPFLLTTMGDLEQNHRFCYRGWTTSTGHCSTIFMGGNFSMAPVMSCVVLAGGLQRVNIDDITDRGMALTKVTIIRDALKDVVHKTVEQVQDQKHSMCKGNLKKKRWWNNDCLVARDGPEFWHKLWHSPDHP
ncbi:hypothetical protein LSH36_55g06028 [Paralvinella palmiformis]|uniref:Uncharacterized protein n=1 Tax=Paralvinella palmiformis TaxID=53620 RepID=A0AAD9K5J0_9ANNE|nr:hypothetical protein LSH36_55g06028 [Paralvinella palmiformis]